jgi:hypothetical protein
MNREDSPAHNLRSSSLRSSATTPANGSGNEINLREHRATWFEKAIAFLSDLRDEFQNLDKNDQTVVTDRLVAMTDEMTLIERHLDRPNNWFPANSRTRDEKGVPVIPGLTDLAACRFDDTWEKARLLPFDDACSVLESLYEFGKHHPALKPEMAILKRLAVCHDELCNNSISERLKKL